jgi:hypothetical protein
MEDIPMMDTSEGLLGLPESQTELDVSFDCFLIIICKSQML